MDGNHSAYKLWDIKRGVPAEGADTIPAMQVLERTLRQMEEGEHEPHPGVMPLPPKCSTAQERKSNYEQAFTHLRQSVFLTDNLLYSEPWAWMQPTRHALGALLLEAGHVAEAEQVYRADLGLDNTLLRGLQHRNNLPRLHGDVECLT